MLSELVVVHGLQLHHGGLPHAVTARQRAQWTGQGVEEGEHQRLDPPNIP